MRKGLIAVSVSIVIGGCASANLSDLKTNPATRYEFDAPSSYEAVYRNVVTAHRECLQRSTFIGSNFSVQADIYNDIGSAEIILLFTNLGDIRFYAYTNIIRNGEGSRVVVLTALNIGSGSKFGQQVETWARGERQCS